MVLLSILAFALACQGTLSISARPIMIAKGPDSRNRKAQLINFFAGGFAGTLKTLGQALTQNLLEKYPALRDVELHFGWSVENNFCLFAVKQLVQTGNNS